MFLSFVQLVYNYTLNILKGIHFAATLKAYYMILTIRINIQTFCCCLYKIKLLLFFNCSSKQYPGTVLHFSNGNFPASKHTLSQSAAIKLWVISILLCALLVLGYLELVSFQNQLLLMSLLHLAQDLKFSKQAVDVKRIEPPDKTLFFFAGLRKNSTRIVNIYREHYSDLQGYHWNSALWPLFSCAEALYTARLLSFYKKI